MGNGADGKGGDGGIPLFGVPGARPGRRGDGRDRGLGIGEFSPSSAPGDDNFRNNVNIVPNSPLNPRGVFRSVDGMEWVGM